MVTRSSITPDHDSGLVADPDLAALVAQFVGELPLRFAAIAAALQEQRWDDAHRLTHQLKGAGGCYGLPDITAAAAHVENAIRAEASPPATPSAGLSLHLATALAELRTRCAALQA